MNCKFLREYLDTISVYTYIYEQKKLNMCKYAEITQAFPFHIKIKFTSFNFRPEILSVNEKKKWKKKMEEMPPNEVNALLEKTYNVVDYQI